MAQSHESFVPPFPRLDGRNWQDWAKKMEIFLIAKDLWTCTQSPPVQAPAAEAAAALKKDQRATAHIVMGIEEELMVHIDAATNAHQIWECLKRVFQRTSAGAKLHTTRQLFELRLQEGGCVRQHVAKMLALFNKLRQLNVPFSEEQKVYILLSSLDPSYETLSLTLESMPASQLNLDYVTGRLQDEQDRRQREKGKAVKGGCFLPKPRSGENAESSVKAFAAKRCYLCNSDNHLQADCDQADFKDGFHGNREMKGRPRRGRRGPSRASRGGAGAHCKAAAYALVGKTVATPKLRWLIDSGAGRHLAPPSSQLRNCRPIQDATAVTLADSTTRPVTKTGVMFMPCLNDDIDVYVLDGMKFGLLSVSALDNAGYLVSFGNQVCTISKDGKQLVQVKGHDGVYMLETDNSATERAQGAETSNGISEETQAQYANLPTHDQCLHLWHRRFSHVNWKYVRKQVECTDGCKMKECSKFLDCRACKRAKVHSCSYPSSDRVTKQAFELVHADLCGPMGVPSMGNSRYVLCLTDDFSRAGWIFTLKDKGQTAKEIIEWVKAVEVEFGTRVKAFQTDRGTEFTASKLQDFFRAKGIKHRKTAPYSPQENGVSERRNRTMQEAVDALLFDSGLPRCYWAEAWRTVCHTLNRTYSSVIGTTPYFLLYGKKPKVHYFRTFGAEAWVLIPRHLRRKGSPRSQKLIFCGYETGSKAWRFAFPDGDRSRVIISRSAEFCEQQGWKRIHGNPEVLTDPFSDLDYEDQPVTSASRAEGGQPAGVSGRIPEHDQGAVSEGAIPKRQVKTEPRSAPTSPEVARRGKRGRSPRSPTGKPSPGGHSKRSRSLGGSPGARDSQAESSTSGSGGESPVVPRRSKRTTKGKPPDKFQATNVWAGFAHCEPESFAEVQRLPQAESSKWQQAMEKELSAMKSLGVFTLTTLPAGQQAVSCRWVYRLKPTASGEPQYKARLVARGFSQRPGVHYSQVYAPTSRSETMRLLLAVAAQRGAEAAHFDIDVAYLNAPLQEEIYMLPPPGFEGDRSGLVNLLSREAAKPSVMNSSNVGWMLIGLAAQTGSQFLEWW